MKIGGREIQAEGTEWTKAGGREELRIPEELKGGQHGGEMVGIDQAVWPRAPTLIMIPKLSSSELVRGFVSNLFDLQIPAEELICLLCQPSLGKCQL